MREAFAEGQAEKSRRSSCQNKGNGGGGSRRPFSHFFNEEKKFIFFFSSGRLSTTHEPVQPLGWHALHQVKSVSSPLLPSSKLISEGKWRGPTTLFACVLGCHTTWSSVLMHPKPVVCCLLRFACLEASSRTLLLLPPGSPMASVPLKRKLRMRAKENGWTRVLRGVALISLHGLPMDE